MTIQEVLAEIKAPLKPYIGYYRQSTFSGICLRIERGIAKPKTIKEFFNKYGYEGSYNNWRKKAAKSEAKPTPIAYKDAAKQFSK